MLGRTIETGRANDRTQVLQQITESEKRTAALIRDSVRDSEGRLQKSLDKLLERHP